MSEEPASVLVVDDERDICENLSDILADFGYEVDTACDGPSALELVQRKQYDLALLDLKMPGMSGLDLYRQIKSLQPETVAMIVTAYASSDMAEAALEAGAWRIIAKPVEFSDLLPLIDEAMEQPLVLIVDDDNDLCDTLWEVFRDRDFRVGVAHDVDEAEVRLRDRSFQVCLVDMKLPQGDGGTVLELVRRSNPAARTVLITGHRDEMETLVSQAIDDGADAVCYKPFDVNQLLDTVRQLAERRGAENGGSESK